MGKHDGRSQSNHVTLANAPLARLLVASFSCLSQPLYTDGICDDYSNSSNILIVSIGLHQPKYCATSQIVLDVFAIQSPVQ